MNPHPVLLRWRPIETTNVALPTGDRLALPTGEEALRLKGYLLLIRNSRSDYLDFAALVDVMGPDHAAVAFASMDRYYSGQPFPPRWAASQLARRLSDPRPADANGEPVEPGAAADWETVRQRCLSVAVAMLEETR